MKRLAGTIVLCFFCTIFFSYPGDAIGSTENEKPAWKIKQKNDEKAYDPSTILVKFKEKSTKKQRNDLAILVGGKFKDKDEDGIDDRYKHILGGRLALIKLKGEKGLDHASRALRALENHPLIEYAEYNYLQYIDLTPNDDLFGELWGLHNTKQTGGTEDADIDASEAWDISTGSSEVVVGVIDTGIDYNHEDLAANMWTNPGEIPGNGIDDDENGYVDDIHGINAITSSGDPMDDHSHGTHCAGTIGAVGNNGIGIAGVNWTGKIIGMKFLNSGGSGSTDNAIESINYAVALNNSGVDILVLSNSWGGGGYSQALKDAIAAANAAGILFIAAAGNSSSNNDVSPHFPSSYDVDNVIAVAATDHNDNKASFSSYGATSVDLGAPGVNILSTVPYDGYEWKSGTSMATPHVAGVAALIKARFPGAASAHMKARILGGVDPIASMQGITVTGGRLNVANAIEEDTDPPSPVTYLATSNPTITTVDLTWIATGDNGNSGTASYYDIRYSTEPITANNWVSATRVSNEPTPQTAGSPESFTVTGLDYGTTFWFAMEVFDNVGQGSGLSYFPSQATETPIILSEEDFESGMNGWSTNGVFGLWELGAPASGPGSAYSGFNAWGTDLDNNYGQDFADENLVSPPIDLTGQSGAVLAFWSWYNTESDWDGGIVEISINDGASWEYVPSDDYDTTLGCGNAITEQAFSGSNAGWELKMLDLTPWAGNTVQVRFRFATDCSINSYPGWYIDDVEILADTAPTPQPPIANAGPDQTVSDADGNVVERVTLDGSSSYDPDGGPLTYEWFDGDESISTEVSPEVSLSVGEHTIQLVVTDDDLDTGADMVVITVNENQAPTADAGPDQEVSDDDNNDWEIVTLEAVNSSDPDGMITSYEWSYGGDVIGTSQIVTYDFGIGTNTVTLRVTDNGGAMDTDTVVITVNPYVPPSSDTVTITKAEYNTRKRELKVEATSTASPAALLTLKNHGEMDYNARKDKYRKLVRGIDKPEDNNVMVTSSFLGSHTSPVTTKGDKNK